jgi:hypothetical protein
MADSGSDEESQPKTKGRKSANDPAQAKKAAVKAAPIKNRAKTVKDEDDDDEDHSEKEEDGENNENANKYAETEYFSQIGSITEYKPGQKFPTPAPANGDRVFYESLLVQRPDSEMAQEWCVAYGILDEKEASRVYKIICKRKGVAPVSPIKVKKEEVPKNSKMAAKSLVTLSHGLLSQ